MSVQASAAPQDPAPPGFAADVAQVISSVAAGAAGGQEAKPGRLIFSDYYTSSDQAYAVLGGIGCGAVLGVLARDLLVDAFALAVAPSGATGRDGVVVRHIVPNMVGCFVMGMCVTLRPQLQPPHPTVYAGLTTGFCGCCTTFSSYNTDVAMLFLRSDGALEGILCALMAIALGSATASAALMLGLSMPLGRTPSVWERAASADAKLHGLLSASSRTTEQLQAAIDEFAAAAAELRASLPQLVRELPEWPGKCIRQKLVLYWSMLLAALAAFVIVAIAAPDQVTSLAVAMVAAPFGAWSRYALGKRNVGHPIPVYTLTANLTAAALSAALAFLLDDECGASQLAAGWRVLLQGVSTGFCGSLSTVSSAADEVRQLAGRGGYRALLYAALTVAGGQVVAVVILFRVAEGC